MAVQCDTPQVAPAAQDDLATDAVLWVVPAMCALFARAVPGAGALRLARSQQGDGAAQLSQLLASAGFVVSARAISASTLTQQAFPVAVFLRGDAPDDVQHAGLVWRHDAPVFSPNATTHRGTSPNDFARLYRQCVVSQTRAGRSDPDAVAATAANVVSAFAVLPELRSTSHLARGPDRSLVIRYSPLIAALHSSNH